MIDQVTAGQMNRVLLGAGDHYELPFSLGQVLDEEREQLERLCTVIYRPASMIVSRKPRETVGTVRVRNYQISVAPRDLTPRTLLGMVLVVTGINPDIARPGQHVLSHGQNDDRLTEALAGLLVTETERALRRHVAQAYLEREEPLSILRGRPLFVDFGSGRRPGTLPCHYELKTTDVLPNQLLLSGIRMARSLVTDERLQRRAAAVMFALNELSSEIRPTRTDFDRAFARLNRQSIHYADPLHLAEAVLFGYQDTAEDLVAPGPVFEVWRLFQDFIAKVIQDTVAEFQLNANPQATDRKRLVDRGGETYREVSPDMVLSRVDTPKVPAGVLDAKYQPEYLGGGPDRPATAHRISNADIYQLLFYAADLQSRHMLTKAPPCAVVAPQLKRMVAPLPRWRVVRWPREQPAVELRLRLIGCPVDAMVDRKLNGGSARDVLEAAPELLRFLSAVARRSRWL